MSKPGRSNGLYLLLFFIFGMIATVWYLMKNYIWFPPLASEHGKLIDNLFTTTLIITGIAFLITQFLLVYFSYRYRHSEKKSHYYPDNKKLEIIWTVVPAIIFASLIIYGQIGWNNLFGNVPDNAFEIEITGEQFAWNIRYPGEDGEFGRTVPELISSNNLIGLDPEDPAGADDVVLLNDLRMPLNHPVLLKIRSKDVLHSVFLPNFRVKMDAVPGMTTTFWFVPTESGAFEMACAELCGLGHYRMRAYVTVKSMEELQEWLRNQEEIF
jgi:cytochrome c oxidase subunit II